MKDKYKIDVVKFSAERFKPESKEINKLSAITWGKHNEYSKFLKSLYNKIGNTMHRRSIDKKIRFLAGNGYTSNKEIDVKRFDKELKKIAKNYEIFNCFAIKIGYNRLGEISTFKSVNIEDLAFYYNKEEDDENRTKGFWISKNFKRYRSKQYEPEFFPEFDPNIKDQKQIYFYSDEDINWSYPEFPTPVYNNGIDWIRLCTVAGEYHLDNTQSGFAGSYLINFPTGIPSADERAENRRDFKINYTGTGAEKVIMTYTEPEGNQPVIEAIPTDSNDTKFLESLDFSIVNTVDAHQIPLPMMILKGQSLSSTNERIPLMEEFQIDYISPRQNDIEFGLNEIFSDYNIELNTYTEQFNSENKIK